MPLYQHMKDSHGEGKPCLEVFPDSVHDLLEVAEHGQHRQHGFEEHTVIPLAPPTQREVGGIAVRCMERGIPSDDQAPCKHSHQRRKAYVWNMGGGTIPCDHQTILVQEETPCAPADPAVMREAFAADLPEAEVGVR